MVQPTTSLMKTHLQLRNTTLALCVKANWTDGTVFAFTEHDLPLTIDLDAMGFSDGDGAVVYASVTGFVRSAYETKSNLRVSNQDIRGVIAAAGVDTDDVHGTRWDLADLKIFWANWTNTDPTMGVIPVGRAYMDQIRLEEAAFVATLRDIADRYNTTTWISLYGAKCRNILGSVAPAQWRCGVQLLPDPWSGGATVSIRPARDARAPSTGVNVVKPTGATPGNFHFKATTAGTTHASIEPMWPTTLGGTVNDNGVIWEAVLALTMEGSKVLTPTDNRTFSINYSGPAPTTFYAGSITWLTGLNTGLSMEIKSFTNGALDSPATDVVVSLFLPMPFDVAADDTFTISAFCDKTVDGAGGCVRRHDNVYNMSAAYLSPTDKDYFQLRTTA